MAAATYKIDLITKTRNGVFVLVLIQRRKWTGREAQLIALQQRVNEYASFALDGELTGRYPEAEGKRVKIRLDIEDAPDRTTKAFLRRIKAALAEHRISFEVSLDGIEPRKSRKPLHQRLIARHPLPSKECVAAGTDLAALAAAYAKEAADNGKSGTWWRVWRTIERARGHRLRASVESLTPQARRWFALWSFSRGRVSEGLRIYRAYLANTGGVGPFDPENAEYLRHVAARDGTKAMVQEADVILPRMRSGAIVESMVLTALVDQKEGAMLLARYPRPTSSTCHDGKAWARHAIAEKHFGDAKKAKSALEMCVKLDVNERPNNATLLPLLLSAFGLDTASWANVRQPWAYPAGDLKDGWEKSPGQIVRPTKQKSPHVFGGQRFTMPACPGCHHVMHAFFVLSVPDVLELAARIPSWPTLPLVGCIDCCVFMVRRDFHVDHRKHSIELLGVAATPKNIASLGTANGTLDPIREHAAAVVPRPNREPQPDVTQIGGQPDWVQDFERPFCPACQSEMQFVAALGTMWRSGFKPEITVNNGSGYQYHFACNGCDVLSVFGQNT